MIGYYNTPKKIQLNKLLALILAVIILLMPLGAFAEITGPEAFDDIEWEQVMEQDLEAGIVQSIVATENYIICLCNVADDSSINDIVYAFYRNKTDENGDPVEPYTLAKRVEDHEWEHGNGMAYNPKTNEIYVALYTNTIANNKGCLYVMDPETLSYKGKVKVSDDYNILGIDYIADKDQYVIQTNIDGEYSIKILDNEFKEIDDFGEFDSVNIGTNYQDLAVSEDYILNFPLVMGLGIGDYLNVFSLSKKDMIAQNETDFHITTDYNEEPESITFIGDGEFLAVVNLYDSMVFHLYKAVVPFNYYVTVKAENGTVSNKKIKVQRGNSATVNFSPDEKYEFSSLTLDGKEQTLAEDATSFTIPNIKKDHSVYVTFTEIPFPWRLVLTIAGICAAVLALLIILIVVLVKRRNKKRKAEDLKRIQEKRRIREEKLQQAYEELDAIESEIGIDPVSELTAATAAEVTAATLKEKAEAETLIAPVTESEAETSEEKAETVEAIDEAAETETAETPVEEALTSTVETVQPEADTAEATEPVSETTDVPAEAEVSTEPEIKAAEPEIKAVEPEIAAKPKAPAKAVPDDTVYMPLEDIDEDDDAFAARIAERFSKYQSPVQALAKKKAEDEARAKAEAERKAKAEAEAKALELERLKAEEAARLKVFEEAAKAKALREEEARAKAIAAKAAKEQAIADEKARKAAEFQAQLEAKMKAFEAALAKADQIEADRTSHHGKHIETEKVEIEVKTTRRVKKNKN